VKIRLEMAMPRFEVKRGIGIEPIHEDV